MPIHETFPTVAPEEAGISKAAIDETIRTIRKTEGIHLHSFLLLRDGKLVTENYFEGQEREVPHLMMSVSKSFTSLAIGIAVDQGRLSLDDTMFSFFPEYTALCDSEYKRRMTLRHLLMMGTGWGSDEGVIYHDPSKLDEGCLQEEILFEPGTKFSYNSAASCLLARILHRVTGQGVHTFLKENLFSHLQIEDTTWDQDPYGVDYGGWGLFMKSYDLLKCGEFLRLGGQWEGNRLLSKAYIDAATAVQIDSSEANTYPPVCWSNGEWAIGYGYQFWRSSWNGFRAEGIMGQTMAVYPDQKLVAVMNGDSSTTAVQVNALKDILLPAVQPF